MELEINSVYIRRDGKLAEVIDIKPSSRWPVHVNRLNSDLSRSPKNYTVTRDGLMFGPIDTNDNVFYSTGQNMVSPGDLIRKAKPEEVVPSAGTSPDPRHSSINARMADPNDPVSDSHMAIAYAEYLTHQGETPEETDFLQAWREGNIAQHPDFVRWVDHQTANTNTNPVANALNTLLNALTSPNNIASIQADENLQSAVITAYQALGHSLQEANRKITRSSSNNFKSN